MIIRAKKLLKINLELLKRSFEINRFKKQYQGDWDEFHSDVQNNSKPVFVLSTGRCGTEFLANLLLLNDNAIVNHSPSPKLIYADRLAFENQRDDFLLGALVAGRFELVSEAFMRKKPYLETNSRATFLAPSIVGFFPKARFIHLVRSPEAFLKSGLELGYYKNRHNDYSRIRCADRELWGNFEQYEKILWLWNETNAFIEKFKIKSGCCNVLTVYSEELFKEVSVVKEIMTFCFPEEKFESDKLNYISKKKVNSKSSEKSVIKKLDMSVCVRQAYLKDILTSVDVYPDLARYKPYD